MSARPPRKRFPLWTAVALVCLNGFASGRTDDAEPVRRALLVGIQDYPGGPGWPPLRGTRADVEAMRTALVERAGFDADDVHLLLDGDATRDAILGGFERLARASGENDLLLFYFAGHGSQLPDQATKKGELADELDDLDETLIPYDTTAPDGSPNDIRDDELRELIRGANRRTKNVVLIFDCCSSGTNVRGELDEVSRFVSPEARGLAGVRTSKEMMREPGSGYSVAGNDLSYVSLAACRANESAFEYRLDTGEGDGSPVRGLFTYSLLQELYSTSQPSSYLDLMDRVRRRVSDTRPQTPVIDGPLDHGLAFHGGLVLRPQAFRLADADGASLRGGLVNGLRRGAELDVYPDEASLDDPARRLGTIRLDDVTATRSRFAWIDGQPPAEGATRWCAILARPGAERTRMGFAIEDDGAEGRELAGALERAPLLRPSSAAEAAFHLRRVREEGVDRWQAFTPAGTALPLGADVRSADEIHRLATSLGRLAALYSVRTDLQNESSAVLRVEASLERVEDGRSAGPLERDDTGRLQARNGDKVRAVLVNRSSVPVYASLVVLSPDGEVAVVSRPESEDDRIQPGKKVKTQTLEMRLYDASRPFYVDDVETFRWIVTTRYHDVRSLKQASITQLRTLRSASSERGKDLDLADADLLVTRSTELRLLPKD